VDGEAGGILIFVEDITHRKQIEEALSGMSRKLIESQEQERARIARELHDDINQRLALLAVELDQWSRTHSGGEVPNKVEEIKGRIIEISRDVQALSHQLHSSKLEYLGLATAAKSFCREVSQKHNVRVNFTENGVPRHLPEEVSVCLFRVLQEALQNAVKYSGTDHFEVRLCATTDEIRLIVRDSGTGFDMNHPANNQGLGLVSMRERVSLVKGTIVIKSKPMAGTEITVHVPADASARVSELTLGAA
jgi:signal transduction histidine kinase